jgi:hypothetical protein
MFLFTLASLHNVLSVTNGSLLTQIVIVLRQPQRPQIDDILPLKVRLHYRAKSMLDESARRVFDKFASSKGAKSAFLLDEFARRSNSLIKFGTLLDSVNAPLPTRAPTQAACCCNSLLLSV